MWYMYSNTYNIHKIYIMAYIYLCSKYYADSIIYIYIYLTLYIFIYIYIYMLYILCNKYICHVIFILHIHIYTYIHIRYIYIYYIYIYHHAAGYPTISSRI